MFRALHVRNFRLFFFGQLISQTGTWITTVVQTLLVLKLSQSGVLLGVLTACQFGPVLLISPWAGTVVDRANKRRLLMMSQGAGMVLAFAVGAAVVTGQATIPLILVLVAMRGIVYAFDSPTRRAFTIETVDTHDAHNAISLYVAVMTGSRVVGPALAGALVLLLGYGWPFIIDGVSYIAIIWSLWAMNSSELYTTVPVTREPGQIRHGIRYARANPDLLVPLVMMASVGGLALNFAVTIPLLVTGPLQGNDQMYALLLATMGIGSVIGALATARRRHVHRRFLIESAILFGIGMAALGATPTLWLAFPISFIVGFASVVFVSDAIALLTLLAEPTYRGRVLALQTVVWVGTAPLGAPLVGWMADTFGARAGVFIGAAACILVAAWAHYTWKESNSKSVSAELPTQ